MSTKTVKDIVSFWPSIREFADAVSTPDDVLPDARVYRWMKSNKIIGKYHQRVLDAAKARGVVLTEQDLKNLNPKGKPRGINAKREV